MAQENLILNGDFEEYWECPDDATQIERCKYVYNPLPFGNTTGFNSTSDYFNACSSGNVNVPNTFDGYQNAYHGNGMVGFGNLDNLDFHYREYVQLSFAGNLQCGKKYNFRAFFNIGNNYRYSLKNIGFLLSTSEIDETDYLYNLYTPQFVDRISEIDDTSSWTLISFDFVADNNYKFLTIGHFEKDSTLSFFEINPTAVAQDFSCYIYIDSASVHEVGAVEMDFPNVFTPNEDGINDVFYFLNYSEMFEEIYIFNRWGNQVKKLKTPFNWDGTSNNENVPDGVYYFKLMPSEGCKSKDNTKYHGMIHLIR